MKLYANNLKFSIFVALLIILSACAPASNSAPPSPTAAPTATTETSTSPMAMETPEGGFIIESHAWLFYQVDPEHRGGNIAFQDLNGSETQLLDAPTWMGDFKLFLGGISGYDILPSPDGKHIAFFVTMDERAQIWVLNVNSLAIDAKLDLFIMAPAQDPVNILNGYLWRQKIMQWSPDGQYLAFVRGLEGSEHRLMTHDFLSHETKEIARNVQHFGIIDWSPDSDAVVYVSLPEIGKTVVYGVVWLASLEGDSLPLSDMSTAYMSYNLGWADPETIVIEERKWEGPPQNIRAININTGQVTLLFDDFLMDAYLLPDKQLLFYNIYEGSIYYPEPPTEREQGIYLLDIENDSLDLLIPSKTAFLVDWYPEIERFLVYDEGSAFLYDLSGEIAWEPPLTRNIFPSPDGNYVLIGNDPLLSLHDPSGVILWSIPTSSADRVLWLPDSSGFIHFGDSDLGVFISLYTENSDWEAQILDNVIWTEYDYKYFVMD